MARPFYKMLDKRGKPISATAIVALRRKGVTIRAIAEQYDVTPRTLYARFGDSIRGVTPTRSKRRSKK